MKSLGDSSDFIHLCELCCCELIDFTLTVKITICFLEYSTELQDMERNMEEMEK